MSSSRHAPSAVPGLVVLLGIAASIFTWSKASLAERSADEQRFRQRAWAAAERLENAVQRETQALTLVQGYFDPAADSSAPEFVDGLLTGEGSLGSLAWIAWVERGAGDDAPAAGPAWLAERVSPRAAEGLLTGRDLGADAVRRQALEDAARTGQLVVSGHVRPMDPAVGGVAVLAALPVFEVAPPPFEVAERAAALRGLVVAELVVQPLLEEAFAPSADPAEALVNVTVMDHGTLLGSVGPEALRDSARSEASVRIGGRAWTLCLRPGEETRRTLGEWLDRTSIVLPPAVFVVMCLLSWIVWAQQRQTAVIRAQVGLQTGALRQKNLALENKERELEEANRRLLEMSNTDPLTGILNRRAFEVQLDKERERSRRSGTTYGLLVFDIDHFKGFNDRYGHAAGDEVLRRVAQLMNNEARRIDCVARYGGEEFVILASGTDAAGLAALAERVRDRVRGAAIANEASPQGVLTVSGGASLSGAEEDPRLVFEAADRCLYQAKSSGRDRVVLAA